MGEYNIYNITTWGLERDRRYGGFKLPLIFKNFEEEKERILDYSKEHKTKYPFYGSQDTLYLRLESITRKQAQMVLNQGKMNVHVRFEILGVKKNKTDENCIDFLITGLAAIDNVFNTPPPEDL